MSNNTKRATTIQEQQGLERAARRGTGFLGFLSDLDWMLSIELEEGKPLDDSKITTAQKMFSFNQGIKFAMGIHSAILFALTPAIYSYIWTLHIQNEWGVHILFLITIIFSLLVKIAIPLWLIEDYYVYPRGITYTYLSWFIFGYSLGLCIPEFIYLMIITIIAGIYFIFKASVQSSWYAVIDKYAGHYLDWQWLLFHYAFFFVNFLPIYLLKKMKKKKPMPYLKWQPLNFIPPEDTK